jgi:hypothetical protein
MDPPRVDAGQPRRPAPTAQCGLFSDFATTYWSKFWLGDSLDSGQVSNTPLGPTVLVPNRGE